MADQLLVFDVPAHGLRLAVASVPVLAREAAGRHQLQPGSAAALAQGLCGALLLASLDRPEDPTRARVDLQLDCPGPLRGLFVDANGLGEVRGMVRVGELDRAGVRIGPPQGQAGAQARPQGAGASAPKGFHFGALGGPVAGLSRFHARPLLQPPHDDQAGMLVVLRAIAGGRDEQDEELHRAVVPFGGGWLDAGLSAYLRADRRLAGELAVEALYHDGEPLAAVGGALVLPASDDACAAARAVGETLRIGALYETLERAEVLSPGNAHALAQEIGSQLSLGPLKLLSEVRARFACRCSREKVVNALTLVGKDELRDMAEKDGGAQASCDFCARVYVISAAELLALAAAA